MTTSTSTNTFPKVNEIDKPRLLDMLSQRFSLADLRELCLHLDIDPDDLGGRGKREQLLELLNFLDRRSRLPDLIAVINERRPDIAVEQILRPEAVSTTAVTTPSPASNTFDSELNTLARFKARGNLLLVVGGDLDRSLTGVASRQDLSDALSASFHLENGRPLQAVALETGQALFLDQLNDTLAQGAREPQLIHHILTGLVSENQLDMIVSLAYDNLLDKAFETSGHPAHLVVDNLNLRSRAPERPLLIQLYGEWRQPRSLIVTEQEINQLLRGRLPDKRDIVDLLRSSFRQKAVLFIGYDLRDTAVNALLDEFAGERFIQPAFALWPKLTQNQARAWLINRNLTVIDADPVPFLQTLLDA